MKKFISIFILIFLAMFFSCRKTIDKYEIDNLSDGNVMILGHRGMGELYKYPGNSFESLYPVIQIGAEGSEIDLQMTLDSVLVLFHDGDLNGNTTCSGYVYEQTWAQIGACKYHTVEHNVYLITLENLWSRLENLHELYFSFDCKMYQAIPDRHAYAHRFARTIRRMCEQYGMTEHVFIEGNKDFLQTVKEEGLGNKLFVSQIGTMDNGIQQAKELNTYGIACDGSSTYKEEIKRAHDEGFRVMCWGAKTRGECRDLLEKSPDIIQTDKPIYMLKVFKRFNHKYRIP
ncbi:MAG: glycerophosphodiester phosphodiesterase family protein [Bacteroidota bacterium]